MPYFCNFNTKIASQSHFIFFRLARYEYFHVTSFLKSPISIMPYD